MKDDFELAAALLTLLGESVPHDPGRDAAAAALRKSQLDDHSALLKIAGLCGEPETPGQFYLCTKIYSWLGRQYDAKTAKYAEAYLSTPGWEALPRGTAQEHGVKIDLTARSRAGILADLGGAYAGQGDYGKACAAYGKAYELEPYRIGYAVELSNAMLLFGRGEESLQFLLRQKKSPYCHTVKYRGVTGGFCYDSSFRDTLDIQITLLEKRLKNKKEHTDRPL